MTLPTDAGDLLLPIARSAIEARLAGTRTGQIPVADLAARGSRPDWLAGPGASFVTLEALGRLRGCIGTLTPHRPLGEDVAHNAIAAAFHDPRFDPLTEAEFDGILIEVSVLSERTPLPYSSEQSVSDALRPGVDGVVLEAGPFNRATFLPQVWDELPDPADFLLHLKRKAGLPDGWWSDDARFETYTVESWREGPDRR
jgi:AmmeMemoRadiSam system protein A